SVVAGSLKQNERERSVNAAATFTRPRFRSFAWLSLGAAYRDRFREWSDPRVDPSSIIDPPPDVGAIASVGLSTARAYDYSIGTQDGFIAAASVEERR